MFPIFRLMSQNCGTRRVDLFRLGGSIVTADKLPMSTAKIVSPERLAFGEDNFRGLRALTAAGRSPAAHSWRQATAGPAGPGVSAWNAQTGACRGTLRATVSGSSTR